MDRKAEVVKALTPEELFLKKKRIVSALAQMAIRRQAPKLEKEDYAVYGADLLHYRIEDTEAACLQIGQEPRLQGETAFPAVRTIQERVWALMRERRERAEREKEEEERAYAKAHPEEYTPFDFQAAIRELDRKRAMPESGVA